MSELDVDTSRTPHRVKEKFFNLTRRYKQVKDKIKTSGAGSDDIETCPHFDVLDKFMGSRDIVNPPFLLETASESNSTESSRSTPSPAPSTSSSAIEEVEANAASGENPRKAKKRLSEDFNKEGSKDGSKGGKATKKKKCSSKGSGQNDDDPWLAIFKESQEREERMMAALERSENNFKDLFLTAIKEFGKMVKKD